MRRVQRCNYPQDHFEKSLPYNPIELQNKITLIENVETINKRKIARKRKLTENEILLFDEC